MTGEPGYITLTVTVRADEETGEYVARCEELGLSSCGESVEDAVSMISDAVMLYFAALEDEGERDRVLEELGITVHRGEPGEREVRAEIRPHDFVSSLDVPVAVPA